MEFDENEHNINSDLLCSIDGLGSMQMVSETKSYVINPDDCENSLKDIVRYLNSTDYVDVFGVILQISNMNTLDEHFLPIWFSYRHNDKIAKSLLKIFTMLTAPRTEVEEVKMLNEHIRLLQKFKSQFTSSSFFKSLRDMWVFSLVVIDKYEDSHSVRASVISEQKQKVLFAQDECRSISARIRRIEYLAERDRIRAEIEAQKATLEPEEIIAETTEENNTVEEKSNNRNEEEDADEEEHIEEDAEEEDIEDDLDFGEKKKKKKADAEDDFSEVKEEEYKNEEQEEEPINEELREILEERGESLETFRSRLAENKKKKKLEKQKRREERQQRREMKNLKSKNASHSGDAQSPPKKKPVVQELAEEEIDPFHPLAEDPSFVEMESLESLNEFLINSFERIKELRSALHSMELEETEETRKRSSAEAVMELIVTITRNLLKAPEAIDEVSGNGGGDGTHYRLISTLVQTGLMRDLIGMTAEQGSSLRKKLKRVTPLLLLELFYNVFAPIDLENMFEVLPEQAKLGDLTGSLHSLSQMAEQSQNNRNSASHSLNQSKNSTTTKICLSNSARAVTSSLGLLDAKLQVAANRRNRPMTRNEVKSIVSRINETKVTTSTAKKREGKFEKTSSFRQVDAKEKTFLDLFDADQAINMSSMVSTMITFSPLIACELTVLCQQFLSEAFGPLLDAVIDEIAAHPDAVEPLDEEMLFNISAFGLIFSRLERKHQERAHSKLILERKRQMQPPPPPLGILDIYKAQSVLDERMTQMIVLRANLCTLKRPRALTISLRALHERISFAMLVKKYYETMKKARLEEGCDDPDALAAEDITKAIYEGLFNELFRLDVMSMLIKYLLNFTPSKAPIRLLSIIVSSINTMSKYLSKCPNQRVVVLKVKRMKDTSGNETQRRERTTMENLFYSHVISDLCDQRSLDNLLFLVSKAHLCRASIMNATVQLLHSVCNQNKENIISLFNLNYFWIFYTLMRDVSEHALLKRPVPEGQSATVEFAAWVVRMFVHIYKKVGNKLLPVELLYPHVTNSEDEDNLRVLTNYENEDYSSILLSVLSGASAEHVRENFTKDRLPWTRVEDEKLDALWEAVRTADNFAKILADEFPNRKEKHIVQRCTALGLIHENRKISVEERDRIREETGKYTIFYANERSEEVEMEEADNEVSGVRTRRQRQQHELDESQRDEEVREQVTKDLWFGSADWKTLFDVACGALDENLPVSAVDLMNDFIMLLKDYADRVKEESILLSALDERFLWFKPGSNANPKWTELLVLLGFSFSEGGEDEYDYNGGDSWECPISSSGINDKFISVLTTCANMKSLLDRQIYFDKCTKDLEALIANSVKAAQIERAEALRKAEESLQAEQEEQDNDNEDNDDEEDFLGDETNMAVKIKAKDSIAIRSNFRGSPEWTNFFNLICSALDESIDSSFPNGSSDKVPGDEVALLLLDSISKLKIASQDAERDGTLLHDWVLSYIEPQFAATSSDNAWGKLLLSAGFVFKEGNSDEGEENDELFDVGVNASSGNVWLFPGSSSIDAILQMEELLLKMRTMPASGRASELLAAENEFAAMKAANEEKERLRIEIRERKAAERRDREENERKQKEDEENKKKYEAAKNAAEIAAKKLAKKAAKRAARAAEEAAENRPPVKSEKAHEEDVDINNSSSNRPEKEQNQDDEEFDAEPAVNNRLRGMQKLLREQEEKKRREEATAEAGRKRRIGRLSLNRDDENDDDDWNIHTSHENENLNNQEDHDDDTNELKSNRKDLFDSDDENQNGLGSATSTTTKPNVTSRRAPVFDSDDSSDEENKPTQKQFSQNHAHADSSSQLPTQPANDYLHQTPSKLDQETEETMDHNTEAGDAKKRRKTVTYDEPAHQDDETLEPEPEFAPEAQDPPLQPPSSFSMHANSSDMDVEFAPPPPPATASLAPIMEETAVEERESSSHQLPEGELARRFAVDLVLSAPDTSMNPLFVFGLCTSAILVDTINPIDSTKKKTELLAFVTKRSKLRAARLLHPDKISDIDDWKEKAKNAFTKFTRAAQEAEKWINEVYTPLTLNICDRLRLTKFTLPLQVMPPWCEGDNVISAIKTLDTPSIKLDISNNLVGHINLNVTLSAKDIPIARYIDVSVRVSNPVNRPLLDGESLNYLPREFLSFSCETSSSQWNFSGQNFILPFRLARETSYIYVDVRLQMRGRHVKNIVSKIEIPISHCPNTSQIKSMKIDALKSLMNAYAITRPQVMDKKELTLTIDQLVKEEANLTKIRVPEYNSYLTDNSYPTY